VLTAAAGTVGRIDIAKAALQELRRAQPNISRPARDKGRGLFSQFGLSIL
jgi:hypothetical protein